MERSVKVLIVTPVPKWLPHDIAKAARALRLAQQCVRKVLKLDNKEHEALLNIERKAELEATCVILQRAEAHIWGKFPRKLCDASRDGLRPPE